MKRYAARVVHTADGGCLHPAVVEIENGAVATCYPLTGEMAATLWLPGELILTAEAALAAERGETLAQLLARVRTHAPQPRPVYAYHACCRQGVLCVKRLD